MRCPQPIIECAKLLKNIAPGDQIALKSDDPATWADLSAWSRMTGNAVASIGEYNFVITKNS
ncbi:MAG: sulfurtransferase TusA family protein [Acidobacteria bacterium]|nr:sulfurtransferase TusA family protein [Acidobacteriota bacterium]